jgi:hypothetical protein
MKKYLLLSPASALAKVGLLSLLLFTACEKDFNYIQKPVDIDPGVQISFSQEIAPIFSNRGCAVANCHASGANSPDLTAGNAYTNLMGYINKEKPESSTLYIVLTDKNSPEYMGTKGSSPVTVDETTKILLWIKQGAKNN